MVTINRLDTETRVCVLSALVEGNSIRSTCRMTGVAKNTVVKLLLEAGAVCSEYMDKAFRNLGCKRIQVDEIWSFVYAKNKNVPTGKEGFGIGSVWTWTAIDADTKLIPSWLVGTRDGNCAAQFIQDLAGRLARRIKLTSDGHKAYLMAVEDAFGTDIDYAMLNKLYGEERPEEARYSPAVRIGARAETIMGQPDPNFISTSYAERQNLTVRMHMRRFTRLTNGFSKKIENHAAALALYFMYYNFVRIHASLRVTPAMAACITGKLWSMYDVVALLDKSYPPWVSKGGSRVSHGKCLNNHTFSN